MIVCDRDHLALAEYVCLRNAFGRQLASFEEDLRVEGLGEEPLRAVFIRAPWVEELGAGVEVLAEIGAHPVAVRQGSLLAVAFHPELTDDSRLHALFMAMCTRVREEVEGDVCTIEGESAAEPLLQAVYEEVLRAGGHPIVHMAMEGQSAAYFEHASDAQ